MRISLPEEPRTTPDDQQVDHAGERQAVTVEALCATASRNVAIVLWTDTSRRGKLLARGSRPRTHQVKRSRIDLT